MQPFAETSMLDGEQEELTVHDLLSQCATNLTEKAARGELSAAYERDQEVDQILTSLASPLKGRIVVTGGARVGKTAVIQEVAARIQADKCPESLRGSEVWSLSARSILRAFGVQGWQDRLGQLMEKWSKRSDIILYVEALPATRFAGATADDPFDMAQFLLGQLQSSNSRIVAEGRTQAVQNFLESYQEYKYVLLEVRIADPNSDTAQEIVAQASRDLEKSQKIRIDGSAIEVAIDLTRRFALNESLPGKAIDLIGEGVALLSESGEADACLTRDDIVARFAEKTRLPRMILTDDEPYDEQAVRRYFSNRVLGQEQAVEVVAQALSLLRTRLNNPDRPMGVFLFMGPTGVGKTELARALAEFLFGSDDVIVRFNMADYSTEWHAPTLFGNPHGFDLESRRGQFTQRLQDHAFAVILLDEFEKAHPDVFQRFLQLFDEGMLINGASEAVNLRNAIVILTSNFGARVLAAGKLGFGPAVTLEEQEQQIREEMDRFFSPELINRIDSVSFFKPLTRAVLREIAYRRVQEILEREGITRRNITVEVDEDVIDWVVEYGYSERYGARYLARQIEKTITYPLAQQLIHNNPPARSRLRLFIHRDRVASALVLPPTTHSVEDAGRTVHLQPHSPEQLRATLPEFRQRIAALEAMFNVEEARARLADHVQALSKPTVWDDPGNLQPNLVALESLGSKVDRIDQLRRNLDELQAYLDGEVAGDHDQLNEALLRFRYLSRELPRAEAAFRTATPTGQGAFIHIVPVGRRADQWVAGLGRMYLNWAARNNRTSQIISESVTGERHDREIWLRVEGADVFDLLAGETGIHYLAQTDASSGKRSSTKALIRVVPIRPSDQAGPLNGGQVEFKHFRIQRKGVISERLQTDLTAIHQGSGQSIRLVSPLSAAKTRQQALALLETLLNDTSPYPHAPATHDVIRRYVRHKRRYVEDLRTGFRSADVDAILDGDLQPLLERSSSMLPESE